MIPQTSVLRDYCYHFISQGHRKGLTTMLVGLVDTCLFFIFEISNLMRVDTCIQFDVHDCDNLEI
jgi:hypothetical protein